MGYFFSNKKPEIFGSGPHGTQFFDLVTEDAFALAEPLDVRDESVDDLVEGQESFDDSAAERAIALFERQAVEPALLLVALVFELAEFSLHSRKGEAGICHICLLLMMVNVHKAHMCYV